MALKPSALEMVLRTSIHICLTCGALEKPFSRLSPGRLLFPVAKIVNLGKFYAGHIPFPVEPLQQAAASVGVVDFVRALMAP